MTTQNLDQFFATFGTAPIRVELPKLDESVRMLSEFLPKASDKDLAELDKQLGKRFAEIMKRVAKEGGFYVKPLTSEARDFFEASIIGKGDKRNLENLRARLVSKSWCYADGTLVGNAKTISEFRADILGELFDCVRHINGMDTEDLDEAGKD